jgi:hypothetical protein
MKPLRRHDFEMDSLSQTNTEAEEGATRGLLEDEQTDGADDEEMLHRSRHHRNTRGKSMTFRVAAITAKALVVVFSCL